MCTKLAVNRTEPVTTTVTVTIRIPEKAVGTLFEIAERMLSRIDTVEDVSVTSTEGIEPRKNATHITVTAELTTTTPRTGVCETLNDTVFIERFSFDNEGGSE